MACGWSTILLATEKEKGAPQNAAKIFRLRPARLLSHCHGRGTEATALLGDLGISDEALLGLITGEVSPSGNLPFELPSSVEEVRQQRSDLPHDSQSPLFPFGFGLHY